MPRKNTRNTKGRIISAAWKLFYEQGYDETTVEDIVFESETSKGSFYHYFDGKDALLGTLANVFDEKYEELKEAMDPSLDAVGKLVYLNHELFLMIDSSVSLDLLARLLSTQLLARGAARSEGTAQEVFQGCAAGLDRLDQEDFSSLWRRLVQELEELNQEGQAVLLPLGDTLGRYEEARQREALSAARRRLEELAGRMEEDSRRLGRVYQVLGLSGGAFLVILLL